MSFPNQLSIHADAGGVIGLEKGDIDLNGRYVWCDGVDHGTSEGAKRLSRCNRIQGRTCSIPARRVGGNIKFIEKVLGKMLDPRVQADAGRRVFLTDGGQ